MIPLNINCKKCGSDFEVNTYRKFTVCPYCHDKTDFQGFVYKEIDKNASMYANVKLEQDCPACRSPHMFIYSYSPFSKWRCVDCGYMLPNMSKLFGVLWFCDNCETYMNIQKGFTTKNKKWTCTECGFINGVSKHDIL